MIGCNKYVGLGKRPQNTNRRVWSNASNFPNGIRRGVEKKQVFWIDGLFVRNEAFKISPKFADTHFPFIIALRGFQNGPKRLTQKHSPVSPSPWRIRHQRVEHATLYSIQYKLIN